jgi:hypothetical protein
MSPRLAISAAISIMLMASFVLSATRPADEPFGGAATGGMVRAEVLAPSDWLFALLPTNPR